MGWVGGRVRRAAAAAGYCEEGGSGGTAPRVMGRGGAEGKGNAGRNSQEAGVPRRHHGRGSAPVKLFLAVCSESCAGAPPDH